MQSNDTPRKYAPREPSVALTCPVCERAFTVTASRFRSYKTHCCSGPCRDTLYANNRRIDPVIRFWTNVDKDGPLPESHPEYGNCWPRRGANQNGYSVFNDGVIKAAKSTHFSWDQAGGSPLPSGTFIGHTCDNPPCVRNDTHGTYEVEGVLYERHGHLWLAGGSPANSRDMKVKGRASRQGGVLFKGRGEDKPTAKLTDADVRAIRALCAEGRMKQIDIGRQFGISQTNVSRVHRREVWDHVE